MNYKKALIVFLYYVLLRKKSSIFLCYFYIHYTVLNFYLCILYIRCHPIVQWLSSVYQVYVKCFDNKILRPLPLLKFLLPQRKNRAFRLCLSGNNLATHKFSSNTIFASILQAQSPENIEYSTFLGLLYHSNSTFIFVRLQLM